MPPACACAGAGFLCIAGFAGMFRVGPSFVDHSTHAHARTLLKSKHTLRQWACFCMGMFARACALYSYFVACRSCPVCGLCNKRPRKAWQVLTAIMRHSTASWP